MFENMSIYIYILSYTTRLSMIYMISSFDPQYAALKQIFHEVILLYILHISAFA
jgi:hypothetical protein